MVSEYIRRSHYNESVSVLSHTYQPGLKDMFRQQHRQHSSMSEVRIIFVCEKEGNFLIHHLSSISKGNTVVNGGMLLSVI